VALRPDGLARVIAVDGAPTWERTGGKGRQYRTLPIGELVHLVSTTEASHGGRWWLVPTQASSATLGWVAESSEDGSFALEPVVPDCPDPAFRMNAADLPRDGIVRLACFGARPLEVIGVLTCESGWAELSIQGAPWTNDQRWCTLDDVLFASGEPVTSVVRPGGGSQRIGPVVIHGHFDDPGSEHCVSTSFGVTLGPNPGPGEPGAILLCRQDFVATELLAP
jgi:hypothetical protein